MGFVLNVIIQKEENWYVAKCIESNIIAKGKNIEETLNKLKESVHLYFGDDKLNVTQTQVFLTTIEVGTDWEQNVHHYSQSQLLM